MRKSILMVIAVFVMSGCESPTDSVDVEALCASEKQKAEQQGRKGEQAYDAWQNGTGTEQQWLEEAALYQQYNGEYTQCKLLWEQSF